MTARRALVIGGSLGGLMVAHLLRSVGFDTVVFERLLQTLAQRLQQPLRRDDGLCIKPLRQIPGPGLLPPIRLVKKRLTLAGEPHQSGAAVMRIIGERHDPFGFQLVDDALHALPVQTHGAREPRHRLGRRRQRNRAEHLPSRAGQPDVGDEPVAGGNQGAVDAKYFEDQPGQTFRIGSCIHDNIRS